jgi:hypothetical protein
MSRHCKWLLPLLLVAHILGGCGIGESGQPLSFNRVAQYGLVGSYRNVAMSEIFVVATTGEASEFAKTVLKADPQLYNQAQVIAEQLGNVDYTRSLVILITPGTATIDAHGITAQQITRRDSRIVVQAKREKWESGKGRPAYVPDPIDIIAVDKSGNWSRQMQFELIVDGEPTVEIAHFIP